MEQLPWLLRGSWDVLMQRATYTTQFIQLALQSACEDRYARPMNRMQQTMGPVIYASPHVMLLMRANPLRGRVGGGWAMEIETFLGPCE